MSTLDERLASRLGNDSIPGKKSPFDEPTHALQKRFDISSYGIKGASVDHGFAEGAVGIELGAAAERELMEFDRKKDAWRTVKAWSEDGSERERKTRWMLVAYRHTVSDNPSLHLYHSFLLPLSPFPLALSPPHSSVLPPSASWLANPPFHSVHLLPFFSPLSHLSVHSLHNPTPSLISRKLGMVSSLADLRRSCIPSTTRRIGISSMDCSSAMRRRRDGSRWIITNLTRSTERFL